MSDDTTSGYPVATTDELSEDGGRVITEVDGQEVAVFRFGEEYFAMANFCVHEAGPLCEGEITGDISIGQDGWSWEYEDEEQYVRCPWHGWVFDIRTGINASDSRYAVPTYQVEVEDETVFVYR